MRIRKKAPKASAPRSVLYFIGYRGTAPTSDELKTWYDLEYGGPLIVRADGDSPTAWVVSHGIWTAHLQIPLPEDHVKQLADQLAWDHPSIGAVAPGQATPADRLDLILVTARLARGLTLLTQRTTFDITTQVYLNPSDWQDRSLSVFRFTDHVTVQQQDDATPERDWFYTLGLSKFGLDELETFRPRGLAATSTIDAMRTLGDEVLRQRLVPKVGSSIDVPLLDQPVHVLRHRTAAPTGVQHAFREVAFG
jgi:hypothetical protein